MVGLYLNPPARAVVFSFDEKTQCQAMDRTQPCLPMVPGRAGTMTHDYKPHGTTDLLAAMNVATGEVLTHCQKGHTAKDVLRFFKQIDASVPRGLAIHVVLDNLSAHKAPEITRWLAHRDRRRWHLHFTPTSSSWLNLIERCFKELTDRRLRRGVFTNVPQLEDAITTWSGHWNDDPKPFIWHATAADIIEKVQRGRTALTRQINSTTEHEEPVSPSSAVDGHMTVAGLVSLQVTALRGRAGARNVGTRVGRIIPAWRARRWWCRGHVPADDVAA